MGPHGSWEDPLHDCRGDITGDGEISEKDSLEFYTWYDPGQYHKSSGTLSSRVPQGQYSGGSGYVDNRFGRAGYLWDPVLEVYHVRHRVYDAADGRWLQPDPNLHEAEAL
ncbi:MAG: hypothetical protein KIT68_11425 [Phycisphaeraceae bacterium]|nr:hypothetical protein [Phycisphaeraceae bacterium]